MDVEESPTLNDSGSCHTTLMMGSDLDLNDDNEGGLDATTLVPAPLSETFSRSASASPSISALALLTSEVDGDVTPPPTAGTDYEVDQWPHIVEEDITRPFDFISADLKALGALSIDDFLSNVASSSVAFDVNFYVQLPERSSSPKDGENGHALAIDEEGDLVRAEETKMKREMVSLLHEASHRVFGSSDCLKFEYLEEDPKCE